MRIVGYKAWCLLWGCQSVWGVKYTLGVYNVFDVFRSFDSLFDSPNMLDDHEMLISCGVMLVLIYLSQNTRRAWDARWS